MADPLRPRSSALSADDALPVARAPSLPRGEEERAISPVSLPRLARSESEMIISSSSNDPARFTGSCGRR